MTIKQQIRNFIEENFMLYRDPDTLDEDKSLLEQGLIDSTGVLELVEGLQSMFDIRVEDDEIIPRNLGSLNIMTRFIAQKLENKTGVKTNEND